MIITKFSAKNSQLNIQANLKGSHTVRGVNVRAKIPGNDRFSSNFSERNFSAKGGESSRAVAIQGYSFGSEDAAIQEPVALVVRLPEDLRRERIKFPLKALDLL